ncbi:MAG: succinate dehydrogenase hydrophobic membrane anchor subunit [Actinomycetota bacterium]
MPIRTEAETAADLPLRRGILGCRAGRERPSGGWELWAWLFMRISGILLLFLAVGHVLIMHVGGTGVSRVDFAFVASRWESPVWRTWDWALLSLALLHGINGLRVVVQDYVRPVAWRFTVNMLFLIVGFVLFVLGSVVVFTFDPSGWLVS